MNTGTRKVAVMERARTLEDLYTSSEKAAMHRKFERARLLAEELNEILDERGVPRLD